MNCAALTMLMCEGGKAQTEPWNPEAERAVVPGSAEAERSGVEKAVVTRNSVRIKLSGELVSFRGLTCQFQT